MVVSPLVAFPYWYRVILDSELLYGSEDGRDDYWYGVDDLTLERHGRWTVSSASNLQAAPRLAPARPG